MSALPAAWAEARNDNHQQQQDDPLLVVLDEAGILVAATELFDGSDAGPAMTAAEVRAHLATIKP